MKDGRIVEKGIFEFDFTKIIWDILTVVFAFVILMISLYRSPRVWLAYLFFGKQGSLIVVIEVLYWILLICFAAFSAYDIKLELNEKDSLKYRELIVYVDRISYTSGYYKDNNKYSSFELSISQVSECVYKRKQIIITSYDEKKHIIKHISNSYDIYMCISNLMGGDVKGFTERYKSGFNKSQNDDIISKEPDISANQSDINEKALRQLKSLLDDGVITQEEYEAKKKQILGL